MDRIASFTINHLDLMPGLYVCHNSAVFRDSFQITVGKKSLRQRTECNNSLLQLLRSVFQSIFLNCSVKDRISVLIDHKWTLQVS